MLGFAYGLAAAGWLAAIVLFVRVGGLKKARQADRRAAEACAKELKDARERKTGQLRDLEGRLSALRDRAKSCSDPSFVADWLDDELARVRREADDPDDPGAGAGEPGAAPAGGDDGP